MSNLSNLQTESRNVLSSNIDIVSTLEMCRIMNAEDSKVAGAVESCLEDIAIVIDLIAARVRENGRVVYIGAGTSGRLGVLDASEIPPTFSAPYSQFLGIMAGGDTAIRKAVEGAEDSMDGAVWDFQLLDPPLSQSDVVIGIASSGRTPYVLGGLSFAHKQGVLAVGICCVKPSEMRGRCAHVVECVVGPEIVTGSTRMKAGTATKLILNMISTGVMIRIGKTYGNLMVDVKPSNFKLIDRARRIFRAVLPHTTLSNTEIDILIESCQYNVKRALVVERHKCSTSEAENILNKAGGVLKRALQLPDDVASNPSDIDLSSQGRLVVCIDAGGTKCKAVIANEKGVFFRGEAGPCNFVTLGHDAALSSLSKAVIAALSNMTAGTPIVPILPPRTPIFVGAWIGGAGLDRSAELASVRLRISALLNLQDPQTLMVTNDAALLSSAIIPPPSPTQPSVTGGIVLIAGTGTLAYSYALSTNNYSSLPRPVNRASGWGYLLGDEGSAFAIGRDAIRAALIQRDRGLPATPLHLALAKHFGCELIGDLIPAVYLNPFLDAGKNASPAESEPKLRVAGVCRIVFSHGFPSSSDELPDPEALDIIRKHASSAAETIVQLLARDQDIQAPHSVLVFGGALGQVEGYRSTIVEILRTRGHHFSRVEHVSAAAEVGIKVLVHDYLK